MNIANTLRIHASSPIGIGDPVTVDGMHGRGVVIGRKGRRLVIRFRSGEYLSRDQRYVHRIESDYSSPYRSGN